MRHCLGLQLESAGVDCGDVVRVSDDMALVHQSQENHGGWADDMALVTYSCTSHVQHTRT